MSLCSSINFTDWRQRNGLISNSQFSCSNISTGLRYHVIPFSAQPCPTMSYYSLPSPTLLYQIIPFSALRYHHISPTNLVIWLILKLYVDSALASLLMVCRTCLTTVGDQSFSGTAPRVGNDLPQYVIASPSLSSHQVLKNCHQIPLFSSFP